MAKTQKESKYSLDVDKAMLLIKEAKINSGEKNEKEKYNRPEFVEELIQEKDVICTTQTLVELKRKLPYTFTLVKAISEKAGCTVDDLLKEI